MTPSLRARIQDFGEGGQQSFDPKGGDLSPNLAQNRGFPLKIACKLHDFEEILGARGGGPGPPGPPLDPRLHFPLEPCTSNCRIALKQRRFTENYLANKNNVKCNFWQIHFM